MRFAAAEALAYLGQTDGVGELARLAEDHPALRAQCFKALASIDDASPLLQSAPRVPSSIIDYVRRTGSVVLFEDALADAGRFASDPYLVRARPRSLLCLPVRRHGALAGILYLDNDLAPGVFTPDRLLALELLATQAAVSLQNASLLAGERAARERVGHRRVLRRRGEHRAVAAQDERGLDLGRELHELRERLLRVHGRRR